MPLLKRAIILVADGVGCGGAPDAADYGDAGADTLGNLARAVGGLALPHLQALGLGNLTAIAGVREAAAPRARLGRDARGVGGQGHDHRALGDGGPRHRRRRWRRFPNGFPREITAPLRDRRRAAACSATRPRPARRSSTSSGAQHMATGDLILYTSADSVLQIAAHEEVVPLAELYRICEAARAIADRHHIGRVIARPFVGTPGAFQRTYNRRDFSLVPPAPTLLDHVRDAGQSVGRHRQDLATSSRAAASAIRFTARATPTACT